MEFICKTMLEKDIDRVVPLYMNYYNVYENSMWTQETTYKRIHQVFSKEDSLCFIFEKNEEVIGFIMGYFEQYDDLKAYDLVEIVIAYPYQNKGIGTKCMLELEKQVKEAGGAMIQLQAVNDEIHEKFYSKLEYKDATNLVLKSKWI